MSTPASRWWASGAIGTCLSAMRRPRSAPDWRGRGEQRRRSRLRCAAVRRSVPSSLRSVLDVAPYLPLSAHLVGSVPLGSAEDVFRTLSAELGDRLRRLPDGETGPRADWIVWQYPVLSSREQFEVAPPAAQFYRALP